MKVKSIDHLVLSVKDIEKSVWFYTKVLAMELERSANRYAVKFGNQKINLHVGKAQFLPAALNPTFGSGDLCFLVEGDLQEIKKEIEMKGVEIEEGIVRRTGAQGAIDSIYLRDPDGNLIELSVSV